MTTSGESWSLQQAHRLGEQPPPEGVQNFSDEKKTISALIDSLNSGQIDCSEGICVAFSQNHGCNYLLYRHDKIEEANRQCKAVNGVATFNMPLESAETYGTPLPPPGGTVEPLSSQFVLHINRLIDVPRRKTMVGNMRKYIIKVFDAHPQAGGLELIKTIMEGTEGADGTKETVNLRRRQRSGMDIRSDTAALYIQVEHEKVMMPKALVLGGCWIHRLDPRSTTDWAYMLTKDDQSAECGIELKVEPKKSLNGLLAETNFGSDWLGAIRCCASRAPAWT